MRLCQVFAALCLLTIIAPSAVAAALRVSPVMLDVAAPQQATSLKVWNEGSDPVSVQVRVFRWTQRNGEDVLEATRDVVASPPIATLKPGEESLVRVVRVTKVPAAGEESYRLLIDELPDPAAVRPGAVTLVIRHSIPVFFGTPRAQPSVKWRGQREAGGIRLTAENAGGRRLRIADLSLLADGREIGGQKGLVGYVLSGAAASWVIPLKGGDSGALSVAADSETGRFDAAVDQSGR